MTTRPPSSWWQLIVVPDKKGSIVWQVSGCLQKLPGSFFRLNGQQRCRLWKSQLTAVIREADTVYQAVVAEMGLPRLDGRRQGISNLKKHGAANKLAQKFMLLCRIHQDHPPGQG
jgi:hypothetical protein